jgi:hypothetical protein
VRAQSTLALARRRHTGGFSLNVVLVTKANAKTGLTGGMNEVVATRLYGEIGRRYYYTVGD